MKSWLQRIAATLLIAGGLACMLVPFRDFASQQEAVETIAVQVMGFAADGEAFAEAWQISDAPEQVEFAGILKSFDEILDRPADGRTMDLLRTTVGEASAFLPPVSNGENESRFPCVYRQHLFLVNNPSGMLARTAAKSGTTMTPDLEVTLNVEVRGRILPTEGSLPLPETLVAEQPGLRAFLDRFDWRDDSESATPDDPEWSQWELLVRRAGGTIDAEIATRAIYDGQIIEVSPDTRFPTLQHAVPHLKVSVKVVGSVSALVGAILLVGLYRRFRDGDGIRIGTSGHQLAGDLVVIVIAAIASVAIIDALLVRCFGVDPLVDDEFAFAMSAIFLVVAVPLTTLYLTLIGAQRLQIDDEGVRLQSLFGERSLRWTEFESIECTEDLLFPVFRLGLALARILQKRLVLKGGSTRIAIMEPPERVKEEILAMLADALPDEWQQGLEPVAAKWRGYESW